MTKRIIAALMAAHVCAGYCAYPTLERANELFSPGVITSTNVTMLWNQEYSNFDNALLEPATASESLAMESFLLSAVTSMHVRVSTNEVNGEMYVNNEVYPDILRDRGVFYLNLTRSFRCFPTNASECVALATYVGSLHRVDFPTDALGLHGFVSYPTKSAEELEEVRRRLAVFYQKQALQQRVQIANEGVGEFRKHLLRICNIAVTGCKRALPDTDFAAFTNQLVTVSGADEEERAVLFEGLAAE